MSEREAVDGEGCTAKLNEQGRELVLVFGAAVFVIELPKASDGPS